MKEKIIKELEHLKLNDGSVWQFTNIGNFKESLNPKEKVIFIETLEEMILQGYFVPMDNGNQYRLTKKCFLEMYL